MTTGVKGMSPGQDTRAGWDVIEQDVIYGVLWSEDGHRWRLVADDTEERPTPAVYQYEAEAEHRRADLAVAFPECHYKVGIYELGRT